MVSNPTNRANDELMSQLASCEEQLRVKRHQMKVAKSSYKALNERLEAETKRREELEAEAVGGGGGGQQSKKLLSDLERSRELLWELLTAMRGATRTSLASPAAVVAALPAIAALLGPGDVAAELLASGVAGLVAEVGGCTC